MKDGMGREISYLRISVTDRCNLRCNYCIPDENMITASEEELLSFTEIIRLVKIFARLGVRRIRLTGGEPLARKGIEELIKEIKNIPDIEYVGMTTNGALLTEKKAWALKEAGLDSLNISLDTTDAEKFLQITKRDLWQDAWAGLQHGLALSFDKIKVNCVLSKESTEQDWINVVALAESLPIDIRLIEWMPLSVDDTVKTVSIQEAKEKIQRKFGPLTQVESKNGGPAQLFQLENFKGRVGFIGAMSQCFCDTCNRVRLSADGDLKLCLFYDQGISLKPLLRGNTSDLEIQRRIEDAILAKPKQHQAKRARSETH